MYLCCLHWCSFLLIAPNAIFLHHVRNLSPLCKFRMCGVDEMVVSCAKPKYCNTCRNRGNCNSDCTSGCDCIPGYYRNDAGICVHESKCPGPNKCGLNEEYSNCGSGCPVSCSTLNNPPICTQSCVRGCVCRRGYVRDDAGDCIKAEECPAGRCGINEVYSECASACPLTCSTLHDTEGVCNERCVRGCICRQGYVRNDNGECVPPEECPKQLCGVNELYFECGSACPLACSTLHNPAEVCEEKCVRGCFCRQGYVRNQNGRCVEPKECPTRTRQRCGANEEYLECGTACPLTCSTLGKPRGVCNERRCIRGCFCKENYLRNDDGKCVELEECPTEKCGPNEVYSDCGTACPYTCENYDKIERCTLQCIVGCFCLEGLVRNSAGMCVPPSQCSPECGVNEEVVRCAKPKSCNTCRNRGKCQMKNCNEGCDCKPGFYRDESAVCIAEALCPRNAGTTQCDLNEEVVSCVKPKACNSCTNRGNCPVYRCKEGCDCKAGFYRNENGVCIAELLCPRFDRRPSRGSISSRRGFSPSRSRQGVVMRSQNYQEVPSSLWLLRGGDASRDMNVAESSSREEISEETVAHSSFKNVQYSSRSEEEEFSASANEEKFSERRTFSASRSGKNIGGNERLGRAEDDFEYRDSESESLGG